MSGHSKWSTIKRKKAAEDAKRGQLFTKLGREIAIAARAGGDPDINFTLRLALERAKAANMPKDTIERAIKRGTGELKGEELEEIIYEGYGPHGSAFLLQVLTDNRNRTVAEIRRLLARHNGSMGQKGSVAWLFQQKAFIVVEPGESEDPEEVALLAIDAGADDVQIEDGTVEIYARVEDFRRVKEALEAEGFRPTTAELAMLSKSMLQLDDGATLQVMRLMEKLEEQGDVQQVYTNIGISDEVMRQYEAQAG